MEMPKIINVNVKMRIKVEMGIKVRFVNSIRVIFINSIGVRFRISVRIGKSKENDNKRQKKKRR